MACEFVGASCVSGRGVLPGVGLYEFFHDKGRPVHLHDMLFVGLSFEVAPRPTLTFHLREMAGDPNQEERTDSRCVDAVISELCTQPPSEGSEPGLVSHFDWDGEDGFQFDGESLLMSFSAARVEVIRLYAAKRGSRPLIRVGAGVCQVTPQCRRRRSR